MSAARTERTPNARGSLVDVKVLAEYLNVDASWVYTHAIELGARRLGAGPKPRLRFDLAEVDERLNACSAGRESGSAQSGTVEPNKRRGRRTRSGTGVELLPIRGVSGVEL